MDDEMAIADVTVPEVAEAVARELVQRRRPFTVCEYHRLGEVGVLGEDDRVELIAGEIVRMAPIGAPHAGKVNRIAATFQQRFHGRAVVTVQNPVRLDAYSEPQPDVMLLRWRDDYYEGKVPDPTDVQLLVEVGDTSAAFDRRVKLALYARAGIHEVWLLDLGARRVSVHRAPTGGGYGYEVTLGPDETVAPLAFADERLDVTDLVR